MNYLFLPLVGFFIGAVGSTAGIGGAIFLVPILFAAGFAKNVAVGTSFVNVVVVAFASLAFYGSKGAVDWRAGLLLAVGTIVGVWLATTFIQPQIDEKMFRYFFAVLLVASAVFVLLKK